MQEMADTTNKALLAAIGQDKQLQLVLSLITNQVETAGEDQKHLEDNVVAILRPVAHRRMENIAGEKST